MALVENKIFKNSDFVPINFGELAAFRVMREAEIWLFKFNELRCVTFILDRARRYYFS